MTKAQTIEQLADGIYHLYSPSESDPVLVHLYDNTDEQCRGIGFNTHDGGGFLPLKHLSACSEMVPISISEKTTFQIRVIPWMHKCFGPTISADTVERNHRFLEEAIELVQACGCSPTEAHQLVDYVYGRPPGEKKQEVGGVMVTLAALCLAQNLNMHECGEVELERIWNCVEQIRQKQAAKPKYSPLPE